MVFKLKCAQKLPRELVKIQINSIILNLGSGIYTTRYTPDDSYGNAP